MTHYKKKKCPSGAFYDSLLFPLFHALQAPQMPGVLGEVIVVASLIGILLQGFKQ